MQTAISEITLVFFTTLAPAGVVACIGMLAPAVVERLSGDERTRIDRWVFVPLVVSMLGLVASSTHLGQPENALYVFTGVGRSPLSREVFAAVVFLALCGVYWLYSFAQRPRRMLQDVWAVLIMLAGLVFLVQLGFAYSVATIPTWSSSYVPAGLWLNALVAGPLLAVACLLLARYQTASGRLGWTYTAVSAIALVANTLVYVQQCGEMLGIENAFTSAVQLVPHYPAMIAAFALLCAMGIALVVVNLRKFRAGFDPAGSAPEAQEPLARDVVSGLRNARAGFDLAGSAPEDQEPFARDVVSNLSSGPQVGPQPVMPAKRQLAATLPSLIGCVLAFAGIFIMRFAFYMMHMTL